MWFVTRRIRQLTNSNVVVIVSVIVLGTLLSPVLCVWQTWKIILLFWTFMSTATRVENCERGKMRTATNLAVWIELRNIFLCADMTRYIWEREKLLTVRSSIHKVGILSSWRCVLMSSSWFVIYSFSLAGRIVRGALLQLNRANVNCVSALTVFHVPLDSFPEWKFKTIKMSLNGLVVNLASNEHCHQAQIC